MPIGTLSFKYTLKNFPVKKKVDTRINVKENLEYLRFGSSFNDASVGVSYISSSGISVAENILIVDDETTNNKNAKRNNAEREYLTDDIMLDFAGFEIADIFKEIAGVLTPFYYWHDLSSYGSVSNIDILDGNMESVNSNFWVYYDESTKLQKPRRGVYTNLKCAVLSKEQKYEIFYLRFTDDTTNEIVTVLLDAKPYYSEVTLSSNATDRCYIVNQVGSSYNVKITFNSFSLSPTPPSERQRYALRRISKSKIFVAPPGAADPSERWDMRISPGSFIHNGYKFIVPEYLTQIYNPVFPYKFLKEKRVLNLNGDLLYTDQYPIANLNTQGFFVYIVVKDDTDKPVRAFTNDPDADTFITKQGFPTDVFYEKDIIQSISASSGFIKLTEKIDTKYKIYMTYRFIEDFYDYKDINLNPSMNPEILGKQIVVYTLPDTAPPVIPPIGPGTELEGITITFEELSEILE